MAINDIENFDDDDELRARRTVLNESIDVVVVRMISSFLCDRSVIHLIEYGSL